MVGFCGYLLGGSLKHRWVCRLPVKILEAPLLLIQLKLIFYYFDYQGDI